MRDYTKRIRELTRSRRQAADACEEQRREIGNKLATLASDERPEGSQEYFASIASLNAQLAGVNGKLARMDSILARQDEIESRIDELRRGSDQIETELAPVFEQIGSVAFRLFREHPLIDTTYSAAFEELARYQDEVRAVEREVEQLRASIEGNKGFVERVILQGRDILLRNRLSSKENRLPAVLRRTGAQLSSTDFVVQMDDPELNQVADQLIVARERQAALSSEIERLKDEHAELSKELDQLTGGRRLAKARSELDETGAEIQQELAKVYLSLGTFAESRSIPAVAEQTEALHAAGAEVARLDALLSRLEAGQRAQAVADERRRMESRLAAAEEQIAKLQHQKDQLEEQIASHGDLYKQLLKERGTEDELFKSE